MEHQFFDNELSAFVWRTKYRRTTNGSGAVESSVGDTLKRVAQAVSSVEATQQALWTDRFLQILDGFRFLPAGRILAAAGTTRTATLFNCFVMGRIDDSVSSIFTSLRESALTMQLGGGIGCDFSSLRPAGSAAKSSGRTASGPVSFMHLWNAMCSTLLSAGNRHGAMMGVLRCDHPDILQFVEAKREYDALTNFNLSVQVTDEFLQAVDQSKDWPLVFPADELTAKDQIRLVRWPGSSELVPCAVHGTLRAAEVWDRIVGAAYDTAEPGVLFVDRINALNNLYYRESITATNPCGEVPLPPFGACNLGSINLAAHVEAPFSPRARLDYDGIGRVARYATRFLDNVIDLSQFPLEAQATEARTTRRIGLGITGLADALIMLGQDYDSDSGRETAAQVLQCIRDQAYGMSIELAQEKGGFPCFDKDAYLNARYIRQLSGSIQDGIAEHGIRNSHLISIAPAGSISILANNVSSGIEPVYAARMERLVLDQNGIPTSWTAVDHAYSIWMASGRYNSTPPKAFVTAHELTPEAHLLMAAALQRLVDNSISKTVNVAENISKESFGRIYRKAYDLGLKGCTVFRSSPVSAAVLTEAPATDSSHCCELGREGD